MTRRSTEPQWPSVAVSLEGALHDRIHPTSGRLLDAVPLKARRMPVLPAITCAGCPCVERRDVRGQSIAYCNVLGEELWAPHPLRTGYCLRDEMALRNVIAGLWMVACYEHGRQTGVRYAHDGSGTQICES